MYGQAGNRFVTDIAGLDAVVEAGLQGMRSCWIYRALDAERFTARDYLRLMHMLFHQTYNSPLTFAIAGANCASEHRGISDYQLHHAIEEKDHWQWALNDLRSAGEDVSGLEHEAAPPACAAFVSFNFYLAHRLPFARIGTAYFLETMSAALGPDVGRRMAQQSGLPSAQMQFFVAHADSDQTHSQDLRKVILDSALTAQQYGHLAWAADTSARLYLHMYEAVAHGH